jgi:predicted nucleotidyltransferase
MTPEALARSLQPITRDLERLGVERLSVFGSHARGEARENSDIDVLVAFRGPASLQRYSDLKFLLEGLWQRKVDLLTEKAIRPELRPGIEGEAIRVA